MKHRNGAKKLLIHETKRDVKSLVVFDDHLLPKVPSFLKETKYAFWQFFTYVYSVFLFELQHDWPFEI